MFWLQCALCFLIWIAYGVVQSRRSLAVRAWAVSIPRTRRGILAAGLMLGAMAPIFVVLILALEHGGFGNNGMTPVVWLGVCIFGLFFVHWQTLSTALLVTMAHESVTAGRFEASSNQSIPESPIQENDDHEASPS